jgi:hypothetical protein
MRGDSKDVLVAEDVSGASGSLGINKAHGQMHLGHAAERMAAPISLMRKFSNFELICRKNLLRDTKFVAIIELRHFLV